MLGKFCSAKTAEMKASFIDLLDKFIFLLSFLNCFHIQCPSAPMPTSISVVFAGEISKYPSTFET